MARGKHAAQAAQRRYEATLELADRLAEKNAGLKIRTKQVESDAALVPALRARIHDLEQMVASGETPKLAVMREEHAARVAHLEHLVRFLAEAINDTISAVSAAHPASEAKFVPARLLMDEESRELRASYGLKIFNTANREHARALAFRRTVGDRNEVGS